MSEAAPNPNHSEQDEPLRGAAPDPDECRGPADVRKIHHDGEQHIWFECVFEPRRGVYTWTIVPLVG